MENNNELFNIQTVSQNWHFPRLTSFSKTEIGKMILLFAEAFENPMINFSDFSRGDSVRKLVPIIKIRDTHVLDLLEVMNTYVPLNQHQQLQALIQDTTIEQEPILFMGNLNQLCDAFRRLHNANIIQVQSKKSLASWIMRNFAINGKSNLSLRSCVDYLLTQTDEKCKSPILKVIEIEKQKKILEYS